MPDNLQPPPDAIPLLDAVERYVRPDVPNQRLKALCSFRRGWGTRARDLSWDDLSVWPEEDERLWILIAEKFLTRWARKLLRLFGCDSDGSWHELSPVLGDSVLVTEVDWSRGIIFPGTARALYGIRVAVQAAPASAIPESAVQKIASTIAAEGRCKEWLVDLMADGKAPSGPKRDYEREARKQFEVGTRAFQRAWDAAVRETGNSWSKPGRKSKS